MRVVNVSGLTYGFLYNGRTVVIPYDGREYMLNDDVDIRQFGNSLRITVPPKPKVENEHVVIENPIVVPPAVSNTTTTDWSNSTTNVVTIDLDSVQSTKGIEIPTAPVEQKVEKKTVKKAAKKTSKVEKKSF